MGISTGPSTSSTQEWQDFKVFRLPHKLIATAMNATTIPIVLDLVMLAAADELSAVPALAVGMAAPVFKPLGVTLVADETGDGVATVVLVNIVVAGLATLFTPHAPIRVLIELMLVRALGVEPQFSDWVIQMMFCSRSKTAIYSVSIHLEQNTPWFG